MVGFEVLQNALAFAACARSGHAGMVGAGVISVNKITPIFRFVVFTALEIHRPSVLWGMSNAQTILPTAGHNVTVTIPSMARIVAEKTVLAYGTETAEAFKPVRVAAAVQTEQSTAKTMRPARRAKA